MNNFIYLASQSKGRLGILKDNGYTVIVCPTDCDESGTWASPAEMVEDLACRKMDSFLNSGKYEDKTIPAVTSDTVVVFEGEIIGKAKDVEEAEAQLRKLSGHTHMVFSSYAVCCRGKIIHGYDCASVQFNDNSTMIKEYLECGEWKGAAGSYRIQGMGAKLIKKIDGDINTVIGLPLNTVQSVIRKMMTC